MASVTTGRISTAAAAGAIALALAAGGAWLWLRVGAGPEPSPMAVQADSTGQQAKAVNSDASPASSEGEAAGRTPDEIRSRLFKLGSFAGTEPAGDWCVGGGRLTPCVALRSRFEYYVLGLGEVSIDDIRRLIQDEARRAHGEQLAADIISVWDKYWQVRTYRWHNPFNQADRSTWLASFEEQRSVRRQILGQAWADAFFKDDEKRFQDHVAQLDSGLPPPPDPGEPVPQMAPGKDPAAVRGERVTLYGEAAADRLAQADAEWAEWQRRLGAARAEWQRLQSAPQLSDVQRKDEMAAYVKANFAPGEQLRVRALLHL